MNEQRIQFLQMQYQKTTLSVAELILGVIINDDEPRF